MKNNNDYNNLFGELRACVHGGHCTIHEIASLSHKLDSADINHIGTNYISDHIGGSNRLWTLLRQPHINSLDVLSLDLSTAEASFLLNNWNEIESNHNALFYCHARELENIYSEQTLYNLTIQLTKSFSLPYQVANSRIFDFLDTLPTEVDEYYQQAASRSSTLNYNISKLFDALDSHIQIYCDHFHTRNVFPSSIHLYTSAYLEEQDVIPIERWISGIVVIFSSIIDMYCFSRARSDSRMVVTPQSLGADFKTQS